MASLAVSPNSINNSWYSRLSSWINPYNELETRIRAIAAKNLSPEQKSDLHKAFKIANSWSWSAGKMKALLNNIPKEYISPLIFDLFQMGNEKEITQLLHNYLGLLDQTSLLELSGFKTLEEAANRFYGRSLVKDSIQSNTLKKEGQAIFKEIGIELKYFIHHLLDVLVGLLGINEIGDGRSISGPSESSMDEYKAVHKIEAFSRLIAYPALLFGLIYANIQFKSVAIILTTLAIIIALAFLIAYQRYWKPCPKDQYGLTNLMIERLHPTWDWTYPRREILKLIEKALMERKGVLLVGEGGCGKSTIAPSMADQIAEGNLCSFLKDPQFFSCGASKFTSLIDGSSLNMIAERFKKYSNQVLFFFDEFHAFFKAEGIQGTTKADDIKVFCDKFKYVIGTTTTKDYNDFIKNQTAIIGRRFVIIHVTPIEEHALHNMLSQYLQVKYPTIKIDHQSIDYLISKAKEFNPETSKIDAAQTLLNRAIKEIDSIEFTELEVQIERLEDEISSFKQKIVHAPIGSDQKFIQSLTQMEKKNAVLKEELKQKIQQVQRMKKIEVYHLKLKEQSFGMADPTIQLTSNPKLEKQWIELHAKLKVVGDFIENKRKELNLPVGLTTDLIDKILKERK